MLFEVFNKGKIRALVTALKDIFEISGWLMCVNQQRQMEFWRHGDGPGLHPSSYRELRNSKSRSLLAATTSQRFTAGHCEDEVCRVTQLVTAVNTWGAIVSSIAP